MGLFFLSTFPSVISADAGSQKFMLNSVHHRRKRLHGPHAHIQSLPVSGQRTTYSDLLENTCNSHAHTFTCTCCINLLFAPQKNANPSSSLWSHGGPSTSTRWAQETNWGPQEKEGRGETSKRSVSSRVDHFFLQFVAYLNRAKQFLKMHLFRLRWKLQRSSRSRKRRSRNARQQKEKKKKKGWKKRWD